MAVLSEKRHASLKTYSKRANNPKITSHGIDKSVKKVSDKAELLRTADLQKPSPHHKQIHSETTEERQHTSQSADSSPSPKRSSALQSPGDLASPSEGRQESEHTGAYSPPCWKTRDDSAHLEEASDLPPSGIGQDKSQTPVFVSSPSKKRQYDSQSLPRDELLPTKKLKGSITSYFKPLPRSSSPTTRSSHTSSDPLEPNSTPPSSPPSRVESPITYPRKSQKRRLTTKASLPTITMSSNTQPGTDEGENRTRLTDLATGASDSNGIELAELALDSSFIDARPADLKDVTSQAGASLNARSRTTSDCSIAPNIENNMSRDTSVAVSIAVPSLPSQPVPIPPRKKHAFRQLHFDTHERDEWIQCKECDKYYDPTSKKSKEWHEIQHKKRLHAKVTKKEISTDILAEWTIDDKKHRIVVVDRKQFIAVRSHAQAALGATTQNLGPILVDKMELWSEIPDPHSVHSTTARVPRFRVFIHYIDDEVVSVVLAERIREGRAYYASKSTHNGVGQVYGEGGYVKSLVGMSFDTKYQVWVSIERIWVREGHRRMGYATKMVDLVRENFIRGMPLAKNQIAFSWPFENGVAFATEYCRGAFGDAPFLVNSDEIRR